MQTYLLFCLSPDRTPYLFKPSKVGLFTRVFCTFLQTHSFFVFSGGITGNILDIESCLNSPFDLLVESVYENKSLSGFLDNISSESGSSTSGCVLISASLVAPENSMFFIEILTENSATFSSINEQSLGRYSEIF
jgi:hypothetical protein